MSLCFSFQQQMHVQQLAAHAAAAGGAMGPPVMPGLGHPHPGMPPTSLPPGMSGISPASLAAAGLLTLPTPLGPHPPGFGAAPLPQAMVKDETNKHPTPVAAHTSNDGRLPVSRHLLMAFLEWVGLRSDLSSFQRVGGVMYNRTR